MLLAVSRNLNAADRARPGILPVRRAARGFYDFLLLAVFSACRPAAQKTRPPLAEGPGLLSWMQAVKSCYVKRTEEVVERRITFCCCLTAGPSGVRGIPAERRTDRF